MGKRMDNDVESHKKAKFYIEDAIKQLNKED